MPQQRFSIENGKLVSDQNGKYNANGEIIKKELFVQNYPSSVMKRELQEHPEFLEKIVKGQPCTMFKTTEEKRSIFGSSSLF